MLIWSFWFCFIIEEFKSFVFLHKFFLGELQNIFPVSDLSNSFFLNKILWKGEFTALTEYLVTVFMTFKSFNFYQYKYNQLKPTKELNFWYLCYDYMQSTGMQILSQVFAMNVAKYYILLTNTYYISIIIYTLYILRWVKVLWYRYPNITKCLY